MVLAMPTIKIIDPVTRVEGHLKIKIHVDVMNNVQQVVDAWISGTLFRGFEALLVNRHPWDAQHITQRICGVCPVPHGMAAVAAFDRASQITPPDNRRICAILFSGRIFWIPIYCIFITFDYPTTLRGRLCLPWQPSWGADKRFDATTTATLVKHYVTALDMRRKAHEMGAIFGGKLPHTPAYIPGGFTASPAAGTHRSVQSIFE